jgi:hypothetical protein
LIRVFVAALAAVLAAAAPGRAAGAPPSSRKAREALCTVSRSPQSLTLVLVFVFPGITTWLPKAIGW